MVAIYARQSIDKKDSLSIAAQIEQCKKYADGDALIFRDKGFSGKNTKRPAFTALMEAVEAGQVQKIFVYRLDRFSRSIADFSRLWEVLERHGVEFNSVTEHFDTSSPMGRAMLNIVLVFAQLERETTAERVKDNYIHRFQLGAWPGGPAPYGFEITRIMDDGRKVSALIANNKADEVKHIFEAYAEPGTSLRSLAKRLSAEGVHGPRRESWDNVSLSRLLHSPLYVRADTDVYFHYLAKGTQIKQNMTAFDGIHACNLIGRRDRSRNKYNDSEGQMLTVANHEGLIDAKLWLRVQAKLENNPQISRANAGKYSWLTGLMKCGKCGYAVKINYAKTEDKFYLICSGRSNHSTCDASIHIDLQELEACIAAELQKRIEECPDETFGSEIQNNASELLACEKKIERLVASLAEVSDISAAYISKEIDSLHREKERLLSNAAHTAPRLYRLDFNVADFSEKKMIAGEFIDRILLDQEDVNIVWKF